MPQPRRAWSEPDRTRVARRLAMGLLRAATQWAGAYYIDGLLTSWLVAVSLVGARLRLWRERLRTPMSMLRHNLKNCWEDWQAKHTTIRPSAWSDRLDRKSLTAIL